ncbi:hypothetical protein EJB05_44789, partial [Eragrostis curvula]
MTRLVVNLWTTNNGTIAPMSRIYRKERPPLTLHLMGEFFVLAAFGITFTQGFYILGLYYLSPTYVAVIQNSIPAIAFMMASGLRLEQVNLKGGYGLAKVVGTMLTIAGATIITLYKGIPLIIHLEGSHKLKATEINSNTDLSWIAGCLLILANCLGLSGWMVLQVPVLKRYPAKLSSFAIILALGLIQLLAVAPFFENDLEMWKLHSGGELLTILYAGVVATGLAWSLKIWCINKGGPLFVAVFQPLQTVMVAIMAAIFLGDQLYTGGLMGAVIIVFGLYCVLWAKSMEKKDAGDLETEASMSRHLLQEDCTSENP